MAAFPIFPKIPENGRFPAWQTATSCRLSLRPCNRLIAEYCNSKAFTTIF